MASPTNYHELGRLSRGELDWHEVINAVVEDVDAVLELRGTLAERPAASDVPDGAKFVVDDSSSDQDGAVFVDRGDSWAKLPVDAPSVSTEKSNNVRVAAKGNVQDKIDSVASADVSRGKVILRPELEYDFTGIRVKDGVTLDYNGATVTPTTDADIHEIEPEGRVVDPTVDLTGVVFTSNVFVFNTAFAGAYRDPTLQPTHSVDGGLTIGDDNDETVFYLRETQGVQLSYLEVRHRSVNCYDSIDIHADDPGSIVNGNKFYGSHTRVHGTGVHTRGTNIIQQNQFYVTVNPDVNNGSDGPAWHLELGDDNLYQGAIFDPGVWNDAWRIESGGGSDNTILTNTQSVHGNVTDNKGDASNSVFQVGLGIFGGHGGELGIGVNGSLGGNFATGFGEGFTADGNRSVAIGEGAAAPSNADRSVAIGENADSTLDSVVIGQATAANAQNVVAIGRNAEVGNEGGGRITVDQLVYGATQDTFANADLNNGEMTIDADEANSQFILRYKDSNGTVQTATIAW